MNSLSNPGGGTLPTKESEAMEGKVTLHGVTPDGFPFDYEITDGGKVVTAEQIVTFSKKFLDAGFTPPKQKAWGGGKQEDKIKVKQTAAGFICPKCGSTLIDQRGQTSANGKALPHFKCSNVASCPGKQPNKTDPTKFWPFSIWEGSYQIESES